MAKQRGQEETWEVSSLFMALLVVMVFRIRAYVSLHLLSYMH